MSYRRMIHAALAVSVVAVTATAVARAQGYEEPLKIVASDLIAKLQVANQHSGTVLDFTDLQGAPNELGRFLAQELSDRLVSAGKTISFVDRANLQTLLRENRLSVEGLVNPESTKKLGNLIGIDTVIFGTITPLGEKIRLSVRAVSVETGKIVAAQSANLPASGGLGDMYTRGVARTSSDATSPAAPQPDDVRSRFRGDSIRVTGKEVATTDPWNCGFSVRGLCVLATLALENLSGIGFDAAIVANSTSIGGCIPSEEGIAGLGLVFQKTGQVPQWRYIPIGGKFNITIRGLPCDLGISALKAVDVATSLAVKIGEKSFTLPISASGVPIRPGKP